MNGEVVSLKIRARPNLSILARDRDVYRSITRSYLATNCIKTGCLALKLLTALQNGSTSWYKPRSFLSRPTKPSRHCQDDVP